MEGSRQGSHKMIESCKWSLFLTISPNNSFSLSQISRMARQIAYSYGENILWYGFAVKEDRGGGFQTLPDSCEDKVPSSISVSSVSSKWWWWIWLGRTGISTPTKWFLRVLSSCSCASFTIGNFPIGSGKGFANLSFDKLLLSSLKGAKKLSFLEHPEAPEVWCELKGERTAVDIKMSWDQFVTVVPVKESLRGFIKVVSPPLRFLVGTGEEKMAVMEAAAWCCYCC